ncbi:hypothetical protein Glove_134g216 [Diversispora epigaea]|uniref:Uncharacterized protein n=1 Tax=Diversispora epigaea TaxID=1348612 RepID=A0A397J3J1_9GLOM|nr:hypothetical protein Glove_134g216 [Diversispora epigaea]
MESWEDLWIRYRYQSIKTIANINNTYWENFNVRIPFSDSTSSFSPLKNTETHANKKEKYISLLTSRHHSLDNLKSDIEEKKVDTGNVRRVRHTIVVNTNLFALTKDANATDRLWQKIDYKELIIWITLEKKVDTGNVRRVRHTIVVNTNLFALTKDANATDRLWQKIDYKELIIWITLYFQQISIGTCRTVRKTAFGFSKKLKDNRPITILSTIHGLVDKE